MNHSVAFSSSTVVFSSVLFSLTMLLIIVAAIFILPVVINHPIVSYFKIGAIFIIVAATFSAYLAYSGVNDAGETPKL